VKPSVIIALAVAALTACHDGARPIAPVADLVVNAVDIESKGTDQGLSLGRGLWWRDGMIVEDLGTLGSATAFPALQLPLPPASDGASRFLPIDLGTPGVTSIATGINGQDQVVGSSFDADRHNHAMRWDKGIATELGTLGGASAGALDINDGGQVVGWSDVTGGGFHAVLWDNEAPNDLGTLGGYNSQAFGINNLGDVTGWSLEPQDDSRFQAHPVLWQNGTIMNLGTLGSATWGEAWEINDGGQIVGRGWPTTNFTAVLWDAGTMIDLGVPGTFGIAQSINARGQIVGQSGATPFFWENGTLRFLDKLAGRDCDASDINEQAQVVGWCLVDVWTPHAVLWEDGRPIDLTPGGGASAALGINARGDIVGVATAANGEAHATLWIRVAPPGPGPLPLP
jgi:probable HAF family extracellular repeat protein